MADHDHSFEPKGFPEIGNEVSPVAPDADVFDQLGRAEAEWRESMDSEDPERLAAASAGMAYALLSRGNPDRALKFSAEGLAIPSVGTSTHIRLLCAGGICHHQIGHYHESNRLFARAMREARQAGSALDRVRVLGNLGIAYSEAGRLERAAHYFSQSLEICRTAPVPTIVASINANFGIVLAGLGRIEEALERLRSATVEAESQGNADAAIVAIRGTGEALRRLGRHSEALTCFERALLLSRERRLVLEAVRIATTYAQTLVEAGDLDRADALVEDWIPSAARGDLIRYAEMLRIRGRIRASQGRFRDAYGDSERAAELERSTGMPSVAEASLRRERGSLQRRTRKLSERVEGWAEAVTHALAGLIEARDESTGQHTDRTSEITRIIGEWLVSARTYPRLDTEKLSTIVRMAPLHDIGKVAIPDAILQKRGPLDSAELEFMRRHAAIGQDVLRGAAKHIRFDSRVTVAADIAGYHHERWDGSGYPEHLQGDSIPLSARIVALADVYDAIRSERPYKPALSREIAARYVRENAAAHFDPRIVQAFGEREESLASLYEN
ncbi:MAG TPA: HD domain-containing phosphohydrolase [Rectinemataceae bacterium]|nr:HD domain-containing phosphohydrolase [Rectinemataceae bacterium]